MKTVKKLIPSLMMASCLSGAANADTIDTFNSSWAGQAWQLQRMLDLHAPLADNSILGTHNSYNADVYTSCDFFDGCRYLDPQQEYSLYDQLRMGARFIELDVHYTIKMESLISYPNRLLLCHAPGSHLGCSPNDRYLTEGLDEVKRWLATDDSTGQVLILYIEDKSEGRHNDLYNQINDRLGDYIYASGGCEAEVGALTKADVLNAGKQVVLWVDGACSDHAALQNLAHNKLGDMKRVWEDDTAVNDLVSFFTGGSDKNVTNSDVITYFAEGINLLNVDNMNTTDNRLKSGVWSWAENYPAGAANDHNCALQSNDGRWSDAGCTLEYRFACEDAAGNWSLTSAGKAWSEGENACAAIGSSFSVPTNSPDNQALMAAKAAAGVSTVWLNYTDAGNEGVWIANGLVQDYTREIGVKVALKGAHGKYFVSEGNGGDTVNANRSAIGSYETFTLSATYESDTCIASNAEVYIRTGKGYYWSAQSDGDLDSDRTNLGSWEKFTLINHSDSSGCLEDGDTISLLGTHNKYVVAESDGEAYADRSSIGSWEKIEVQFQ